MVKPASARPASPSVRTYIDLLKAALRQVDPMYYSVPTTYKPGITRERVFCYELYHQMRLQMSDQPLLTLHGEVDKSGHKDFRKDDQRNPDFIFHRPGTHNDNMLVVEVKGKIGGRYRRGIKKDFCTLLTFIERHHYRAGVFVLFGHSFVELKRDMSSTLQELRTHPNADAVYILCLASRFDSCEEYRLSDLNLDA